QRTRARTIRMRTRRHSQSRSGRPLEQETVRTRNKCQQPASYFHLLIGKSKKGLIQGSAPKPLVVPGDLLRARKPESSPEPISHEGAEERGQEALQKLLPFRAFQAHVVRQGVSELGSQAD